MGICGERSASDEEAVGRWASVSHGLSNSLPVHEAPPSADGHGADLRVPGDPAGISGGGHSSSGEDIVQPQEKRKPRKKRSGKKRPKRVTVAQFVRNTCDHLQEKNYPLVWAAVNKLGVDGVRSLVMEVDVVEKCGGQMTNDGKRRRTPGGVMWNILRGRVEPAVYKEIMSQANEAQKERAKEAKESLKRNRMDVDAPASNKRQKLNGEDVDMTASMAGEKKHNQSHRWPRPVKKSVEVMEAPQRDVFLPPVVQMQRAWVEGIRKKLNVDESAVAPASAPGASTELMQTSNVASSLPEKGSIPLSERLRIPVPYNDLIKEEKSAPPSEREEGQNSDREEGALSEDGKSDFEDKS